MVQEVQTLFAVNGKSATFFPRELDYQSELGSRNRTWSNEWTRGGGGGGEWGAWR